MYASAHMCACGDARHPSIYTEIKDHRDDVPGKSLQSRRGYYFQVAARKACLEKMEANLSPARNPGKPKLRQVWRRWCPTRKTWTHIQKK
jgi:hypothetical protein